MASLSGSKAKGWRIQFYAANGERPTIRLPKGTPETHADSFRILIDTLVQHKRTGAPLTPAVHSRLSELTPLFRKKLEEKELVQERAVLTLEELTEEYLKGRPDLKPRTVENLKRAQANLVRYFGGDKLVSDITEADSEAWGRWLQLEEGEGLAKNTARRRIGRAKQYFRWAIRRRVLDRSPFDGMVAAVNENEERFVFVSGDDVRRIMEAAPDAEWRAIIALSRWGGLRTPSETLSLKLTDINWEHCKISVPSPKTEHIEGKAKRIDTPFPRAYGASP